jgi:diguanylate cyclase (GGDEF)-like protein
MRGQGKIFSLPFWPEVAIMLAWNALFLVYLLWWTGTHGNISAIDYLALPLGTTLSFLFCLNRGRQTWQSFLQTSTTQQWSFILLCAYLFFFVLGTISRIYITHILKLSPSIPSWGEISWFISDLALFGGIMLLPRHPWEITSYLRITLDGLIIMISVIAFSWYFVLGPTILESDQTILSKVVETAYPLCDLLLFYCLLFFQSTEEHLKTVSRFLSLGLIAIMLSDSLFDHYALEGSYVSGGLINVGWLVGTMFIGLAALMLLRTFSNPLPEGPAEVAHASLEVPKLWRALIPYLLVPLVAVLIVSAYLHSSGNLALRTGLYLVGIALVGAILLRQILHAQETISYAQTAVRLTNELQSAHAELWEKNQTLSQVNQRLAGLTTTDYVTGLKNHRALIEMLDLEIARSRRHKHTFSLLFLNLDHFKIINDTYGYEVGDKILREIATVLQDTLRTSDILGRWGGEEFIAILPETDVAASSIAARRVCSAVAEHNFSTSEQLYLTCSLGVTTYPNDTSERDNLINMARDAMHLAKNLGRNQFHFAHELEIGLDEKEINELSSHEENLLDETVEALSTLLDVHDQSREKHGRLKAMYATKLALQLGLDASQAHLIGLASHLYDIGKVAIPQTVLLKTAPLTEDEWTVIHQYPDVSADMLSSFPSLSAIIPLVRSHHERVDGKGYPDQLLGEAIPIGARILAVVDAFDAMTTDRAHQKAHDTTWALAELRLHAGTQFDAQAVTAFESLLIEEMQVAVEKSV